MKIGDLMVIKITGEPVQVVGLVPANADPSVTVRHVNKTEKGGIFFEFLAFFPFELETPSERLGRDMELSLMEAQAKLAFEKEIKKIQEVNNA